MKLTFDVGENWLQSDGLAIEGNVQLQWNEFVESVEIIPLETNENSLVGTLNAGIVNDDRIYIFDFKQQILLSFDLTGKFIRQIGQRGAGPSEYLEIRDFCVTNDRIYILDFRKMHSFDKISGEHVDSWPLNMSKGFNPVRIFVVDKEHYYLWCSNPDVWDRTQGEYYRMREIKNGKMSTEYFKFEYRSSEDQRFYSCGDYSAYLKPIDGEYTVYKLTKDSLYARFSIDFGKYAISPKEVEELRNSKERNAYFKSNYFKSISDVLEVSGYIYFNCIGPGSYTYECLVNKNTGNLSFGKRDHLKAPHFFYSDGTYLYGYYEPYALIDKKANGDFLNTCFNLDNADSQNIKIEDNIFIVKVLLKE